ncbi:MAG: MFS transporter [Bacteroidetes bacterium GWF2_38_335]|nr:MAG: MFS transporter [Bacteroidetes bacterium GWF2_38_335]OFY80507.1 MAG: MFS transporter [Bacteroidetes bacterium RIFOXYA12_FULL_38_20]HBS85884.1 2-oxoacid:acceptor oxidoreductase subunit alpha [Bacteroidales bacterium]
MTKQTKVIELEEVVVKFAGDSGDGMQLTGTQFSDSSAMFGNDLSTFPDYPSEIRAPQGTIAGVSGFQVHIGHKEIATPGDLADVLVAMNPAALKKYLTSVKIGGTIIIDIDNFDNKSYKKAEYSDDPLSDGSLNGYTIVKAPISSLTLATVNDMNLGIDNKTADKTKNQFVMGMLYWLFNRNMNDGIEFLKKKFSKKPVLVDANIEVLKAGYNYAETIEAMTTTFMVSPLDRKGKFRNITGNVATAWGLIAASERSGRPLFLGSYPITPATEILQELSARKHMGVKTFQAEDEIAGICSAIGASYTGHLAATSTSGPGLALKSEAIGLAVITELPLVVVNVQRGGPATGLPTKPEQADLLQALYGRNGESPCIVIAASTPANCYDYAYMAAKLSVEHMTPVILLTDGYLANGSELMQVRPVSEFPEIKPRIVKDNDTEYKPYLRDAETLARSWAMPGQEGLRHRVGGLEKSNITGEVSHDPFNHEDMVVIREEKVQRVADYIPEQTVIGEDKGELLVVGWGGTYGALISAVQDLQKEGRKISLCQFNYIKPLPKNVDKIFSRFDKIVVCELNLGQFKQYLQSQYPKYDYLQFNKVQGLPFLISELKEKFYQILEEK